MAESDSKSFALTTRVFIIRPWHNHTASLYPPIMDGVEYIDGVINKIRQVFSESDGESFEVRVDEDAFIPGFTLRQNLERELTNADLVLALLDGLRPNVVYELGFAYGQRNDDGEEDSTQPKIICLAERNATVLVRNFYPQPLSVPTVDGKGVTILNPKLDICKMLSDNADLLVLTYDRLDLDATLARRLRAMIAELRRDESKQNIAAAAAAAEETPEPSVPATSPPPPNGIGGEKTGQPPAGEPVPVDVAVPQSSGQPFAASRTDDVWRLYEQGQYRQVIQRVDASSSSDQKKASALSMMKLGLLYEAIRVWQDILRTTETEKKGRGSACFHLGVCHYAIGQPRLAMWYFLEAKALEGSDRTEKWIRRTRDKLRLSGDVDSEVKGNDEASNS